MPYKSEAQRRLMQAVAHNPKFAKKVGIPSSVGKKFEAHKAGGGLMRLHQKLAQGGPIKMQGGGAYGGSSEYSGFDPVEGWASWTPYVEPPPPSHYNRGAQQGESAASKIMGQLSAYDWSDPYNLPELNMQGFIDSGEFGGGRGDPREMITSFYNEKRKQVIAAANKEVGEAPITVRDTPIVPVDPASLIGTPGQPSTTQPAVPQVPGQPSAPQLPQQPRQPAPLDPRLQEIVAAGAKRYKPSGEPLAAHSGPNVTRTALPGNTNRLQTLQSTLRGNLAKRKFKEGGAVRAPTQVDQDVAEMLAQIGIKDLPE